MSINSSLSTGHTLTYLLCCTAICFLLQDTVHASSETSSEVNWGVIKQNLFGDDPSIQTDDLITLSTPKRAANAAVVPIGIQANIEQDDDVYIRKIYLVIDNNPSPLAAVFTLTRLSGLADLSTFIRINAYSNVRVIAETSDGKLHMAVNFVKASGGFSIAPEINDGKENNKPGTMLLTQSKDQDMTKVQFIIKHPNHSGLQIDQLSRQWIPAYDITDINFSLNHQNLLSFAGGISMSKNPAFSFYFKANTQGAIQARANDSQGHAFIQQWPVAFK